MMVLGRYVTFGVLGPLGAGKAMDGTLKLYTVPKLIRVALHCPKPRTDLKQAFPISRYSSTRPVVLAMLAFGSAPEVGLWNPFQPQADPCSKG